MWSAYHQRIPCETYLGFGNTRRHDTDADFRHQLDRHSCSGVRSFQIVNQLLQILDRVDIMVRRRRNKRDARSGVTGPADRSRHLVSGQFTAFSRLGTLSHLDLQLVRVGEVIRRDTETARRDLLDGGATRVPDRLEVHGVRVLAFILGTRSGNRERSLGILAAFTRVRLAAETVHGDCQSSVRLHGN